MYLKFLKHSTGSGADAIKYLLDELDHNGRPRAEVRVLLGDPRLTGRLIDAITNLHRYSSGVVSWHVADAPTDEEIYEMLADIQRIAFAGLEPEQYNFCAVLHVKDDGSKHVHFVVPRIVLTSGKALNISSPGWQSWADPVRNYWNFAKGWARPEDPERARLVRPPLMAPAMTNFDPANSHQKRDPRTPLVEAVVEGLVAGTVRALADVIDVLREHGEVTRRGPDYVSVVLPDHVRPIRLKGLLFRLEFDREAVLRAIARVAEPPRLEREPPDLVRAEEARQEVERVAANRSRFHRRRYPVLSPAPRPTTRKSGPPAEEAKSFGPGERLMAEVEGVAGGIDVETAHAIFDRPTPVTMTEEVLYDRNRDAIARQIQGIFEKARRSLRHLVEAAQRAMQSSGQLARASQRLGVASDRVVSTIAKMNKTTQAQATPDPDSKRPQVAPKSRVGRAH